MVIAVGLSKGFLVEKKTAAARPASRKGYLSTRVKFVRDVVKEVAGLNPYERRLIELLKVGRDKRCLKLAKQRLGTHKRGKAKREEMTQVIRTQKGGAEKKKAKK
eukprot:JP447813.1.p2 GENE.JP447813.1~~JP447813.1.p2  ORF type:complete len:105 (+),score=54.53 JP447813.1:32-346(+)